MRRNGRSRVFVAALAGVVVLAGLGVTGVVAPPVAGAAASIRPDRDIEYVSGGVTVHASLRAPADGTTGVPAALIIGGTGGIDRNGNAPSLATDDYSWLADRLSAQGIASIRYDKLGTGATGLGPYAADPDAMLPLGYDQLRIQPARDALSLLARQPGVDPSRLLVVGHSEGGAVALALAHDPGDAPAPAGLALVEPAYTHILDIVGRQLSDQMQAAVAAGTMDAADAATLSTWMHDGIAEIRAGAAPFPPPGPVPLPDAAGVTAQFQTAIETNIYGSDPAQMVLTHAFRTRYGKEYDQLDPEALAATVAVPTLITCGTKDFNTPCGPGTPGSGVAAVAASFPPGVARFVVLADTVHILRDVGDDDPVDLTVQATYPFSAELASAFDTFVASFVAPPPATPSTTTPAKPTAQPVAAAPAFTG